MPAAALLDESRSLQVAALAGAGLAAQVDEIVFHQLLQWHRFYDLATPAVGVVSDGLLHAAGLVAVVAGLFGVADLRRRGAFSSAYGWAGGLIGAGGFQLFDGIVDHKLLRVHQVRYGVDLLPYDLVWNAAGLAVLTVGVALWLRARGGATR